MSHKWNEKSTLVFLNAYQKYPCLWNPSHVKYYDCLAKNEALKNIIKELNRPELNMSDCLEQIKVIREKYGQEQLRIIKALQSLKPYKPSFVWFPVISQMLATMINDEGKLRNGFRMDAASGFSIMPTFWHSEFRIGTCSSKDANRKRLRNVGIMLNPDAAFMRKPLFLSRMRSMRTPSYVLNDCVTTPYDKYKNMLNFPCAQKKTKEYNFKNEVKQYYKTKPRKSTKFTKTGYVPADPDELNDKEKCRTSLDLLQCPSCGWENAKSEKLDINTKKTNNERVKLSDVAVPGPEYTTFVDKPCEEYNVCRRRTIDNIYQQRYIVPCPSFPHNWSSYPGYCSNILSRTFHPQNAHTNQETQAAFVAEKPQLCTREVQLSSERLFPEKLTKQVGTSIEGRDKGIQNTICVSRPSVASSPCKCATVRRESSHVEVDTARKCHEEAQSKSLAQGEFKQVAINTVEQCDRAIQNCIDLEKATSTTRESELVDVSVVKCPGSGTRDVVGIRLKTTEFGFKPNFILISVDGDYTPLMRVDPKLERLTSDKCQKDTGELRQDQKEVEKARFTLNDKRLIENEACITETCSRDTMEIVKHNSVVKQALLQCLEKMIQFQEESGVNSNSSETIICEPCKFADENTNVAISSAIKSASPNCLPCVEEMEKTDVIATLTNTFLELMKHALILNNKKCVKDDEYISKKDAVDTFSFLNKMKECADKILKIHMIANCLQKKQPLSKFCSRRKGRCPPTTDLASNSMQTAVSGNDTEQFAATYGNSADVEVLYEPPTSGITDHSVSEDHIALVETTVEEGPSVKDEEAVARAVDNHDVALHASSLQVLHQDLATQCSTKQLRDTGVATEHDQMISVATQNREPILLRVIKCDNSGGVLKLDKETCVRDAHVAWTKRAIEKYAETYNAYPLLRSRLSRNTYRKYLVRESYNEELHHPDVFHDAHEREVNRIDYRTSSLSRRNYRRERQCRSSLPYNRPQSLEPSANECVSRIPLYARSRKHVRRRARDLHHDRTRKAALLFAYK